MRCSPSFEAAMLDVMQQGVDPERGNVAVSLEIGRCAEIWSRISAFAPAGFEIVPDGVNPASAHIGICLKVPGAIEKL